MKPIATNATLEQLIEQWEHDADSIEVGAFTDLSARTGIAAARASTLREVVFALKPIAGRNRFAEILALHDPENVPHGKSRDYYVGWHRAIEAALRLGS